VLQRLLELRMLQKAPLLFLQAVGRHLTVQILHFMLTLHSTAQHGKLLHSAAVEQHDRGHNLQPEQQDNVTDVDGRRH
jgi:hypothetical protein